MSELTELLARVESATSPDRDIEQRIALTFAVKPLRAVEDDDALYYYDGNGMPVPMDRITASIDTALALVERKLPKFEWHRRPRNDDENSPTMIDLMWPVLVHDEWEWNFADADDRGSAPIAIIAALLKALIAQDKSP